MRGMYCSLPYFQIIVCFPDYTSKPIRRTIRFIDDPACPRFLATTRVIKLFQVLRNGNLR
jgi:hypothetical protein